MNSNKVFSVLVLVMAGITLLAETPSAYARHARQADGPSAQQVMADAGLDLDNSLYNQCAGESDRNGSVLRDRSKYLSVMLKSFARSACRPTNDPAKLAMAYGSPGSDALGDSKFPKVFAQLQRGTQVASLNPSAITGPVPSNEENAELIKTYALLFGLGLRESDGNFNVGADRSVSRRRKSSEIESGAFQTSYNVHSCLSGNAQTALNTLEHSYMGSSSQDCMGAAGNATPDASADSQSFQRALKSCPALAVEDAAITIRHCKAHYGPLIRNQAKTFDKCKPLLKSIADQVASNPDVCRDLQVGGSTAPGTTSSTKRQDRWTEKSFASAVK